MQNMQLSITVAPCPAHTKPGHPTLQISGIKCTNQVHTTAPAWSDIECLSL